MISNYDGVLLHSITVYLPPDDVTTSDFFIRQIRFIVEELILRRNADAKIVIMGDFNFNTVGRKKLTFLDKRFNKVVEDGEPTHKQGNTSDQIYTNLEVIKPEIISI